MVSLTLTGEELRGHCVPWQTKALAAYRDNLGWTWGQWELWIPGTVSCKHCGDIWLQSKNPRALSSLGTPDRACGSSSAQRHFRKQLSSGCSLLSGNSRISRWLVPSSNQILCLLHLVNLCLKNGWLVLSHQPKMQPNILFQTLDPMDCWPTQGPES